MTLRTCARCAANAVRTLGREDLCADCAEAILAPIRARVLERDMLQETTHGRGEQAGPLRPDYGHGWADLACDQCGATWTGRIGEACAWCHDRYGRLLDEQHDLVLTPPDIDPDLNEDDTRRMLAAWVERLDRAIETGIIDVREASHAYRKAVGRERAA